MDRDKAWDLLRKYNEDTFHLRHALTVEGVMKYYAQKLGYEPEYWGVVGLLHDIDFEEYPDEHCMTDKGTVLLSCLRQTVRTVPLSAMLWS